MLSLAILLLLYFLPSIIGRNKADATGIFLLNLFLGWTFIGWVIALFWACSSDHCAVTYVNYAPAGPAYPSRFCCGCGSSTLPGAHYCTSCGRAL
jgi:hypothetical protein